MKYVKEVINEIINNDKWPGTYIYFWGDKAFRLDGIFTFEELSSLVEAYRRDLKEGNIYE